MSSQKDYVPVQLIIEIGDCLLGKSPLARMAVPI